MTGSEETVVALKDGVTVSLVGGLNRMLSEGDEVAVSELAPHVRAEVEAGGERISRLLGPVAGVSGDEDDDVESSDPAPASAVVEDEEPDEGDTNEDDSNEDDSDDEESENDEDDDEDGVEDDEDDDEEE